MPKRVRITYHQGRGFIATARLRGGRCVDSNKWGRKKLALRELAEKLAGLLDNANALARAQQIGIDDLQEQVKAAGVSPEQHVVELRFLRNRAQRSEALRVELKADLARAKDELRLAKTPPAQDLVEDNIGLRAQVEALKAQLADVTGQNDRNLVRYADLHHAADQFHGRVEEIARRKR